MNSKIILFLLFSTAFLVGCGSTPSSSASSSSATVVPVYQGMEIHSANSVFQKRVFGAYGDPIDQENPFNLPEGERIEAKITEALPLEDFTPLAYYAVRNEQIIITVNVLNPTGYEILSFTLNGYKYQSYQFEDGSDSERLLLKTTIPDLSGIVSYTIDQIKYVDGTEIKDVLIEGNQTVEVGVRYPSEPTIGISDVVLTQSSYAMNLAIVDTHSVMVSEETIVKAFLFDGTTLIQNHEVLSTTTELAFDGLASDTLYQYAIVGVYDAFDGDGPVYHYFHKEAFFTRPYLEIGLIIPTKTSVSFAITENDPENVGEITAIELYKGETLIESLSDLNVRAFSNLLSYNEYTIQACFTYNLEDGVGERVNIVRQTFTTIPKSIPTVSLYDVVPTQTSVTFALDITDEDSVGELSAIELWQGASLIQTMSPITGRMFTGLLSDTAYTIKAVCAYDLNDGLGEQSKTETADFTTLSKTAPTIEIEDLVPTQTSISFELSIQDPDSLCTITKIELYNGDLLVEALSDLGLRSFGGLTINTGYQIRATYVYNLNDGAGQHTETTVKNVATLAQEITVTGITILNSSNPKVGEEVHVSISLNNPDAIIITAFIINDQIIDVVGGDVTTSAIVRFIPDFLGGMYEVVIDAIQYLSHGVTLEQNITSSYSDDILILGDIQVVSVAMEDELDYVDSGHTASEFVIVEIANPTGYDVSGMKIAYSEYAQTYSAGEITMLDDTHVKVPWKGNSWGTGWTTLEVTSLTYGVPGFTYSTKLFNGHKISVLLVLSDTVRLIHTPLELGLIETGYVYQLANDIDLNGIAWTPLPQFFGVFDGNNHTINHLGLALETTSTETQEIGLFSSFQGYCHDLTITNAYVSSKTEGNNSVGVFTGNLNSGWIENVHTTSSVVHADSPRSETGGLFGYGSGIIRDCSVANTSIDVETTLGANVGGIAGQVTGSNTHGLTHCQTEAVNLYVDGCSSCVGGIVGYAALPISLCYVNGAILDVNATSMDPSYGPANVAGIVGSGRNVYDCFVNDSDLILAAAYDGYLAGIVSATWGFDTVERCLINRVTLTADMPGACNSGPSGNSQLGLISAAPTNAAVIGCLALDSNVIIDTTNTVFEYGIAPNAATLENCFVFSDVFVTFNGNPWTQSDPLATLEQLNHAAFYVSVLGWDPVLWNLLLLNYENHLRPSLF